jgi:hypothetical protein
LICRSAGYDHKGVLKVSKVRGSGHLGGTLNIDEMLTSAHDVGIADCCTRPLVQYMLKAEICNGKQSLKGELKRKKV